MFVLPHAIRRCDVACQQIKIFSRAPCLSLCALRFTSLIELLFRFFSRFIFFAFIRV
jgi:hypothetical protein